MVFGSKVGHRNAGKGIWSDERKKVHSERLKQVWAKKEYSHQNNDCTSSWVVSTSLAGYPTILLPTTIVPCLLLSNSPPLSFAADSLPLQEVQ
ncbi:hypothetical protein J6590_016570 [Homalodisca vitripennis]|nr:hypothetical protein J6590_016570 [Homalodisca vitripennis]